MSRAVSRSVRVGPHDPAMTTINPPSRVPSGPAARPRPSSRCRFSHDLHLDWDALRRDPAAVRRASAWQVTDRPFGDLDELLVHAGYGVAATPETERTLHALLVHATDDDLAGRIVLQRILPGLLAVVRRRNTGRGTDGAFEELLGAAWITIRTYGRDRRPSCLAAALIGLAAQRAFRSHTRRRSFTELPIDPVTVGNRSRPDADSPCEELAELLGAAREAGIDDEDLAFVRRLLELGSPGLMAEELDVTPRTIRNRRDRITYRLRRVALAA